MAGARSTRPGWAGLPCGARRCTRQHSVHSPQSSVFTYDERSMWEKVLPADSEQRVGGPEPHLMERGGGPEPHLMEQDQTRSPGEGTAMCVVWACAGVDMCGHGGWRRGGRTTEQPGERAAQRPLGGAARRPCGAARGTGRARSGTGSGGEWRRTWLSRLLPPGRSERDIRCQPGEQPDGGGRRRRGGLGPWRGRWRHSPGPGLGAEGTWMGQLARPSPALRGTAQQADP